MEMRKVIIPHLAPNCSLKEKCLCAEMAGKKIATENRTPLALMH
jgi:hypothetical protein